MAKGFFRELKHYTISEISKELETTAEETTEVVGILKRYGIMKAVKASKPEYEDLTNQDIVLTDTSGNSADTKYVFDFVGIVMVENHVIKCYPKYIVSTTEPMGQLKKVLKVIKKYNDKEQLVHLSNGESPFGFYNRLTISLYLLDDYFQYGVYTNQHEMIETNGEGDILWDRTIDEANVLIQNNKPYYVELRTRSLRDDETDYFRRLHECILSQCTMELGNAGVLELFDLEGAELTDARIVDFGDMDYIKYRLDREIRTQFITRKRILLKTLYTYVSNNKSGEEDMCIGFYGTNSFYRIWEKVCAENFDSVLDEKLENLPLGVCTEYADQGSRPLVSIIDRPVWHKNKPEADDTRVKTLIPDLVCIYHYKGSKEYCFGIYDAKYYCINFKSMGTRYKVTGQPGVEDITKQYLYQLAYDDFIKKQGYGYVQNMFLCPQETAEPDYGYVEMKMLRAIGGTSLDNIMVVKLCAEEMYDLYLSSSTVEHMTDYIPDTAQKILHTQRFADRMSHYLQRISKVRAIQDELEREQKQKVLIYPQCIKREFGAKMIYDIICPMAMKYFYGFYPYDNEPGNIVAEGKDDSSQKCEQIAEVAIDLEQCIKKLSDQDLENEANIKGVLRQCFYSRDELSQMVCGNSLDMLTERIMELVKTVYL